MPQIHKTKTRPLRLWLIPAVLCLFISVAVNAQQEPDLFSYRELVQLYEQETPHDALQTRLNRLLTTPFVSNSATAGGVKPLVPRTPKLGEFLRIVEWNIERGLEYDAIRSAFTDPTRFAKLIDSTAYPRGSSKRKLIREQIALMKQADVIVLNEVDWGLKRTGYRNVTADLASALGMNYAYGVEFVEVDPIALGLEKFPRKTLLSWPGKSKWIRSFTAGCTAPQFSVASRWRTYDYNLSNINHTIGTKRNSRGSSPLEKGKRKAGELVFQEKMRREVRRGGRMMLTAEIVDARIPGGRMVVVATHLEDKTKPEGRRKQLEELLARIQNVQAPLVVAGDMNTSTHDSTPTSVERELKKRLGSKSFWIKQGLSILTGIKLPRLLLMGVNTYRRQGDPTVRNIPLVASNPEAEFFDRLKDFRFADGSAFDFRGERERSIGGKDDPLANSNQRGAKGFITTYEVERTISFVGKFKLDWIFVKPPSLTEPYDEEQPHRFAPHFGRTLKSLNDSMKDRISDHAPIMVDLPLAEPPLTKRREKRTIQTKN